MFGAIPPATARATVPQSKSSSMTTMTFGRIGVTVCADTVDGRAAGASRAAPRVRMITHSRLNLGLLRREIGQRLQFSRQQRLRFVVAHRGDGARVRVELRG